MINCNTAEECSGRDVAWAEASASMLLFNSDQVNILFGHLMTDQLIGADMLYLT